MSFGIDQVSSTRFPQSMQLAQHLALPLQVSVAALQAHELQLGVFRSMQLLQQRLSDIRRTQVRLTVLFVSVAGSVNHLILPDSRMT